MLPDSVEPGAGVEEVLLRLGQGVVGQVQHLHGLSGVLTLQPLMEGEFWEFILDVYLCSAKHWRAVQCSAVQCSAVTCSLGRTNAPEEMVWRELWERLRRRREGRPTNTNECSTWVATIRIE